MKSSAEGILGYSSSEGINNSHDFVFYDTVDVLPVSKNKGHFASLASVLSVENGYFGTRSCLEECYGDVSTGATYIAGVYMVNDDLTTDKLAVMPDWTRVCVFINDEPLDILRQKMLYHRRYFDIQGGTSVRELKIMDSFGRITYIKTEKFASLRDKHLAGQAITVVPENYSGNITIQAGIDGKVVNVDDARFERKSHQDFTMLSVTLPEKRFKDGEINSSKIVSMIRKNIVEAEGVTKREFRKYAGYQEGHAFEEFDIRAEKGKEIRLTSLISIYTNEDTDKCVNPHPLCCNITYEIALSAHKAVMKQRFSEAGVVIEGDATAQKYANYSIARLIMAGEHNSEKSSITARTLTGPSYAGHVFWDCEMFDLPFFTYTEPQKARTMLMYRYNTLKGARRNREIDNEQYNTNHKGARFAWESTSSGVERTPTSVINEKGQKVRIFTGTHEKHITPDVAYAVNEYCQATGDDEFLCKYGAELIFETARYSYCLLEEGTDGKLHTKNVIGPDEYHEEYAINPLTGEKEGVHDNAYTNVMICHNLEIAAKTAEVLKNRYTCDWQRVKECICLDDSEVQDWITAKNRIYINQSAQTGVIEQFEDFHRLKEIDLGYFKQKYGEINAQKFDQAVKIEHNCNPDFDPDKNNYKVLKQPDVVMLMALFPEKYPQSIQKANYGEYEPRTSHGSSLSVGIHSLIAARIDKTNDAYRYYLEAGGIDINDGMGNAANGIHAATLGATWQALIKGFGGMYLSEAGLSINPRIPEGWSSFTFNVQWHGKKLHVRAERDKMLITVFGNGSIPVSLGQGAAKELVSGNVYSAAKTQDGWRWRLEAEHKPDVLSWLTGNFVGKTGKRG